MYTHQRNASLRLNSLFRFKDFSTVHEHPSNITRSRRSYRDLYISTCGMDPETLQTKAVQVEGENRNLPIRIVTMKKYRIGTTPVVFHVSCKRLPRRCRSLATYAQVEKIKGWLCKPASRLCFQIVWTLKRSVRMKGLRRLGNGGYK